jgi:ribonuclease HI
MVGIDSRAGVVASVEFHIELIGDAREVIRRANMALANGHVVQRHAATFLALATKMPPGRIRWIKREQNLAGIALAARYP